MPTAAPSEVTLVRINGGRHVLAGFALATGRLPRHSALGRPSRSVRTTSAATGSGRRPTRPSEQNQQIHFFKNVSMLGGLLIAAGDTEGKPGLAWRAKHAGRRRPRRAVVAQPAGA